MSFGGHSPKPGRHAPKGKPEPKATSESDSGGSTPMAEGGHLESLLRIMRGSRKWLRDCLTRNRQLSWRLMP